MYVSVSPPPEIPTDTSVLANVIDRHSLSRNLPLQPEDTASTVGYCDMNIVQGTEGTTFSGRLIDAPVPIHLRQPYRQLRALRTET